MVAASFTAAELSARLAAQGVMHVSLDRRPADLLDAVRQVAPRAEWDDHTLHVHAAPAARAAVLDVIRASGAAIRGLTAEEGRLDAFYRDLVGGKP